VASLPFVYLACSFHYLFDWSFYIFRLNRYFIRVTISRRLADVTKEKDLWVHSYRMPPEINNSIKMEVGIEDCLHIEFEYNKSKYVLTLMITAIVYFTTYYSATLLLCHLANRCAIDIISRMR
jgi:hypothetical protein